MKRWLLRLSFQKKILCSFGLLSGVFFAAFLIFFIRSYDETKETELEHMREFNGQLSLSLNDMIDSTNAFRYLHFADDKIRNLICSDDSDIDPENHENTGEKLTERLTLLMDMGNYVLRAAIVTEDGRVYENLEEENSDYIKRMNELTRDIRWKKTDRAYFSQAHREVIGLVGYDVITMISPMWNIIGEEPIATIYLDLDFKKITNQWHQSADVSQSVDFMVLGTDQLLFDSADGWEGDTPVREFREELETVLREGKAHGELEVHGENCVAAIEKNDATGWYLLQYMPVSNLSTRIWNNMSVLLAIFGAVVLIAGAGSYLLARSVSRPVLELSRIMGGVAHVSGEEREIALFQEGETVQEDEIGQMIHSYNAMAKRINDNIIKEYIYQLNQKKTELQMLQFQINPHFLYNTLNTISSIAQLQDVEYIPEIATGLSDMFRYNINGREIVALREEIQQTENYMCIQKIRFPQRFIMETDIDEELKECEVLKFILQPVVENAYKYGFKKKHEKDILRLGGHRTDGDDMILTVEDNGVGIEPEKVQMLNEAFRREDSFGEAVGIGLRNVNSRLKNYYGEEYGIRVESQLGSYTRVYLKLKYVCRSEEK